MMVVPDFTTTLPPELPSDALNCAVTAGSPPLSAAASECAKSANSPGSSVTQSAAASTVVAERFRGITPAGGVIISRGVRDELPVVDARRSRGSGVRVGDLVDDLRVAAHADDSGRIPQRAERITVGDIDVGGQRLAIPD